jgi:hypothetical protein
MQVWQLAEKIFLPVARRKFRLLLFAFVSGFFIACGSPRRVQSARR